MRLFSFASYNKRNTQQCTTARQTAPGQGFWIPTLLSSLFSGIKRLPQTIPHTQRDARSAITRTRFKIQHTPWTWFLLAFSHLRTYDLDDGYTHHTTKIWGDDHYYERRLAYGLKLRLTTISDMERPNQFVCVADCSATATSIPGLDSTGSLACIRVWRKSMSSWRQTTMSGILRGRRRKKDTGCR